MTNLQEVWRPVKHYENVYLVSNLGNVKRKSTNIILKAVNNGSNYWGVSLCVKSKAVRVYVHRIVAESFIPNPENKAEVNHIDGDRSNNSLANLEWVTRSENHHHRYKILKQDGVNKGKTGILNWRSKVIYQKDLAGSIINMFHGSGDAEKSTGIKRRMISKAAKYEKMYNGFLWSYAVT